MVIESYRQIMRILRENPRIQVTAHRRPEYVGQIRRVTLSNRDSFYSVVEGQPEHEVSRRHHGKGSNLWLCNRQHIKLERDVCKVYDTRDPLTEDHLIMAFRVLEDAKSER